MHLDEKDSELRLKRTLHSTQRAIFINQQIYFMTTVCHQLKFETKVNVRPFPWLKTSAFTFEQSVKSKLTAGERNVQHFLHKSTLISDPRKHLCLLLFLQTHGTASIVHQYQLQL
jgi:hypothetical protein